MRYEDLTRRQRAKLMLESMDAYMALLGPDQYYLLLDGIARSKPHVPQALPPEERWRRELRKAASSRTRESSRR